MNFKGSLKGSENEVFSQEYLADVESEVGIIKLKIYNFSIKKLSFNFIIIK